MNLLDVLTDTIKPDYRSPAALAYRMSKPAAYYDRQCKVRKARAGQYPAKPLGPKELPSVEKLIANAKINKWGQIHSCGWYLGDRGKDPYGNEYYGDNEASTLEDCMVRAHAAILERRARTQVHVPSVEKTPRFVTGQAYASIDDVIGENSPKLITCMAQVGDSYVGCSSYSMPINAEALYAWLTSPGKLGWNKSPKDIPDMMAGYEREATIRFPVVKGATLYGVHGGYPCAWMQDGDGALTKLWEGEQVSVAHTWVAKASVLFTQWKGRAPKLESIEIAPAKGSSLRGGACNGWLVMPVNPEHLKL